MFIFSIFSPFAKARCLKNFSRTFCTVDSELASRREVTKIVTKAFSKLPTKGARMDALRAYYTTDPMERFVTAFLDVLYDKSFFAGLSRSEKAKARDMLCRTARLLFPGIVKRIRHLSLTRKPKLAGSYVADIEVNGINYTVRIQNSLGDGKNLVGLPTSIFWKQNNVKFDVE